jgi:hypothetical protein
MEDLPSHHISEIPTTIVMSCNKFFHDTDISTHLLQAAKTKYNGKCTIDGYISNVQSIKKIGSAKVSGHDLSGNIHINIIMSIDIIMYQNDPFYCKITKLDSNMGAYLSENDPFIIIIPFLEKDTRGSRRKKNDIIRVKIRHIKCQEDNIVIIAEQQ